MEIKQFSFSDMQHAIKLLTSRQMSIGHAADFPKLGVIVIDNGIPVAMGFLRELESVHNSYILDSLITNSNVTADIRDKALDDVVVELILLAKLNHISGLIAYTSDNNTVTRAVRHGFEVLPHTVISLDLSK